jgi:hypothetical protein
MDTTVEQMENIAEMPKRKAQPKAKPKKPSMGTSRPRVARSPKPPPVKRRRR